MVFRWFRNGSSQFVKVQHEVDAIAVGRHVVHLEQLLVF